MGNSQHGLVVYTLLEMRLRGLYLVWPHGSLIHAGLKRAVLKSRPFRIAYEPLALVQGKLALGIVVLAEPWEVEAREVKRTYHLHLVSEKEVESWWPRQEKLFLYSVARYSPFSNPVRVEVPRGVQVVFWVELPDEEQAGQSELNFLLGRYRHRSSQVREPSMPEIRNQERRCGP